MVLHSSSSSSSKEALDVIKQKDELYTAMSFTGILAHKILHSFQVAKPFWKHAEDA